MQYTKATAIDALTGLSEDIYVPLDDAGSEPIKKLADYSALALSTLLAHESVETVKVARFELPSGKKQYLIATDKEPELEEKLAEAGRELRHGDIYEADRAEVREYADEENPEDSPGFWTKSEAVRKTQTGVEDPITREDLKRDELQPYIERLEEFIADRQSSDV